MFKDPNSGLAPENRENHLQAIYYSCFAELRANQKPNRFDLFDQPIKSLISRPGVLYVTVLFMRKQSFQGQLKFVTIEHKYFTLLNKEK